MALNASNIKQESNFKRPDPLEPGAYPARVVQILSLGLQAQQPYQGKEKPPKPELYITYEILDEFLKDDDGNDIEDKPRWISERFALNSIESDLAKSTKRYFALDPENKFGGDWAKLIEYPCMVNIINNKVTKGKNAGKVFDKVGSISTMREKEVVKAPDLVNDPKVFDIDEPDMEVFLSLPQWLQEVMTKDNLEFEGSALEAALKDMPDVANRKDEETEQEVESDDDEDDEADW